MGYRTIGKQLGEKATTVGAISRKWKKFKIQFKVQDSITLSLGSMQDLTSWGINDHEEGEGSAQNYTAGPGQ